MNVQKFGMSCSREVDGRTGLISYTYNWTLGPPDLPYDPLEALDLFNLVVTQVTPLTIGFGTIIETFEAVEVGTTSDTFNRLVPAAVTLERNASGSLWFGGVEPLHSPDMTRYQLELEVRTQGGASRRYIQP